MVFRKPIPTSYARSSMIPEYVKELCKCIGVYAIGKYANMNELHLGVDRAHTLMIIMDIMHVGNTYCARMNS